MDKCEECMFCSICAFDCAVPKSREVAVDTKETFTEKKDWKGHTKGKWCDKCAVNDLNFGSMLFNFKFHMSSFVNWK